MDINEKLIEKLKNKIDEVSYKLDCMGHTAVEYDKKAWSKHIRLCSEYDKLNNELYNLRKEVQK